MATVLLLGTCDTKLSELLYTKTQIESHGTCTALIMDIGRNNTSHPDISITQSDLLGSETNLSNLDRAEYISALAPHATAQTSNLLNKNRIHAILAIGGSCGTGLATTVMRDALPVGFPKLMVSTMASGDVAPYIGETDIAMMYSVVDIAGRNRVLDRVLANAAGAIAGMASTYYSSQSDGKEKAEENEDGNGCRIAISMFGVTTPAAMRAQQYFQERLPGCEVYIFHATGSGGRAMERLIREGHIDAVLDLTTTEMADEVVGGVLNAGPERLCAATERDIPRVISVGACDMVNFGSLETVPRRFQRGGDDGSEDGLKRLFHEHNPTVTLMRTTGQECAAIARRIGYNIRGAGGRKCTVVLPTGGVSMLDAPGQPFWDPEADKILFDMLEEQAKAAGIPVVRDPRHINDTEFAQAVAEDLVRLIQGKLNEETGVVYR
ncbi:hypothetical protein N7474_000726 [Penicillium riverlandense]|uniref:uncharacterized protein n=1 Tax=Penicillium riverlandense TaxID=1903569 RepID=UPI002547753A|nr:uncharacterized protein N7474_000726 [Penicillium riverlandense]KAJ5832415.1 hypothetical protein N7474_000726 [Penicillium riverlandense]